MMLNPFPVQFLSMLAFTFLRHGVSFIFLYLTLTHLSKRRELSLNMDIPLLNFFSFNTVYVWCLILFELLMSIAFFLGLHIQIAALLTALYSVKFILLRPRFRTSSIPDRLFFILLFYVSLTLFVTGAGAFAFDLPI